MTNEEKAREITRKYREYIFSSRNYGIEQCLLEMAKWKERQMINSACEFIAEWFYEHPHTTKMVCSDEFENIDDLINRLEQAMKGGE